MSSAVAVVLAAGKGRRMKSGLPKVLHPLCGRPMIEYLLDALRELGVGRVLVVIGYRGDLVRRALAAYPELEFVEQAEQRGTGHAVWMCRDLLNRESRPVVVLCGDAPLVRTESIGRLIDGRQAAGTDGLVASAMLPEPAGYGRIVRTPSGALDRIVEQKDATPEQREIREINSGLYAFDGPSLVEALAHLRPNNSQGELYLTDCVEILRRRGKKVDARVLLEPEETIGINTRAQLAEADRCMQWRVRNRVMDEGVTLVDPQSAYLDSRVRIGEDTIVHPFSVMLGRVTVGRGCSVGPFAYLGDGATIDDGAVVGAFEGRGAEHVGVGRVLALLRGEAQAADV